MDMIYKLFFHNPSLRKTDQGTGISGDQQFPIRIPAHPADRLQIIAGDISG
jgi:hypothetical protein